jgi:hypothetical protein
MGYDDYYDPEKRAAREAEEQEKAEREESRRLDAMSLRGLQHEKWCYERRIDDLNQRIAKIEEHNEKTRLELGEKQLKQALAMAKLTREERKLLGLM